MNTFDDIFDLPAEQPEAETPVQEKPQRKREWWQIKEEKQRKEAYDTLDRIFTDFSEGKGDVLGYLDTHSRFDRYSSRNALLIHSKKPGGHAGRQLQILGESGRGDSKNRKEQSHCHSGTRQSIQAQGRHDRTKFLCQRSL